MTGAGGQSAVGDRAVLDQAEAVGLRLRACVEEAVRRVPGLEREDDRTAKALAGTLKMEGVVAKRVARLLRERDGRAALTRAPKPRHLYALAERAQAAGVEPLIVDALRDAVRRFDALMRSVGPAKADLTVLLRSERDGQNPHAAASDAPADVGVRVCWLDGGVVRDVETGAARAAWWDGNLLAMDDAEAEHTLVDLAQRTAQRTADRAVEHAAEDGGGATVITWAGSPDAGLFERSLASWSPAQGERLRTLAQRVSPAFGRLGARWLIRPHARQALSDVQRCVTLLGGLAGMPVGCALDPAALLEPAMLDRLGDHLTRAVSTLGPGAGAVFLASPEPVGAAEAGEDADAVMGRGPLASESAMARQLGPLLAQYVIGGGALAADRLLIFDTAAGPEDAARQAGAVGLTRG